MTLRPMPRWSCAIALLLVLPCAWGLGFGPAPQTAVLGRPLDVSVLLRLDPGETLPVACVRAQVRAGDIPLPADRVVWTLSPAGPLQAVLRVRTTVAIGDPVLDVLVSAGCPPRVSRRYTLLADPPGHPVPPLPMAREGRFEPAPDAGPAPVTAAATTVPAAPRAVLARAPATAPAPTAAPAPAPAPTSTAAPPPLTATAPARSTAPSTATATSSAAGPQSDASASPPSQARGAASRGSDPATGVAGASIASARLRLEPPTPAAAPAAPAAATAVQEAAQDVAQAPDALEAARETVIAAQEQAAAAHARADALEKRLLALQGELRRQGEQADALRLALERAQASSERAWWALAAVALGLLLALWVWIRVRSGGAGDAGDAGEVVDVGGRKRWWRARAEPTPMQGLLDGPVEPVFAAQVPAGEVSSPSAAPSGVPAAPQPSANPLTPASVAAVDALSGIQARPHPLEEDPEAMSERTRLMPSATAQGSAPLQAVSMEELLELEQHVEFLVVLGQERAAAAQLTDHLQRTGGAYPLPYLKLMEIQRRIGDEQGYETLRAQFNQRFNAVAPAFGAQVQVSRGLEDYPASLVQIERLWGRPVDAMALLENLLFRNRDGEFFDLAALGDVVFLYTLARDLERHAGASTLEVDVLLMLEEEAAAPPSTTQPTQSQALEWSSVDVPMIEEAPSGGSGAVAPPRIIKSARL